MLTTSQAKSLKRGRRPRGFGRAGAAAFCSLAGLLLLFAAAPFASAQTSGSATLRVNVKDPNGAVVPDAGVTITSERTGDQRNAKTSGEGTVTFSSVSPDVYTLRVQAANFKAYEQRGLRLNPSDTRGVDATLEVGAANETVTVVGTAQEIQTETGARENTISSQQIDNLSIVGRSALELLRIQPGVVAPNPDDPGFQSVGFNSGANANTQYHVNGLRGEQNNVSIDGSRVIDIGSNNGTIITANTDMVQEVKVQSSNYAAEHGTSGVQITATTKGGGKDFHGEVYDYIRNNRLNANDRSRTLFGIPRPKDKYQYPGGNLGGPLCLPRFGEGGRAGRCYRDKLFFFFGFEVQRQIVDPGLSFGRVPTQAQRQGQGFTNQNNGQSFNLTPAQIDPTGQALVNLYPLPNFTDVSGTHNGANYVFSGLQPLNRTQGNLRIDYKRSDKTNIYMRLAREGEQQEYARGLWWNPSAYELPSHVQGTNLGRSAVVNITSVINPTMTNEVVFSASKLKLDNNYKDPSKVSASALGLSTLKLPLGQQSPYAPLALITSWGNPNIPDMWEPGNLPLFAHNASYSVTDNLTKIHGAHALKFGGLIEQGDKIQNFQSSPEGFLIYAPWGPGSTGDVFADMLSGKPAEVNQSTTVPAGKFRFYNYEAYAQDSWKLRSNFTLEYGVRVAFFPQNKERQGLGVVFDPKSYDRSQSTFINNDPNKPNGVLRAALGQIPKGLLNNPPMQLAPRLNFAWDIFGNASTVIRGGAGIFYNRVQGNYQYYVLQQPPNSFGGGCGGTCGINFGGGTYQFAPVSGAAIASASRGIDLVSANLESNDVPRVANMSLSIARRLPHKNVLEIGYVGTLARHLPDNRNINVIPLGFGLSGVVGNANLGQAQTINGVTYSAAAQRLAVAQNNINQVGGRPFPAWGNITYKEFNATSNYHSLQVTLSRQTGKKFTYYATYTFAKALGTTAVDENGSNVDPLDVRHRSYGVLPYDRTHVFNMSYTYLVPNGARGALDNRFTRGLLNGWQWSGITTIQSGNPIRLLFTGDIAGGNMAFAFFGSNAFETGNASSGAIAPVLQRNPLTGSSSIFSGSNFGDRLLDLSAIQIPGFGSSGATISPFYIRAPGRSNFDMTFFKNFNFTESRKIQFRAAFFNIFNQAFARNEGGIGADINTILEVRCNVRLNGVPNGNGTSNNVCDPTQGFHFSQNTINNFGRVISKHGHRITELAVKFYF